MKVPEYTVTEKDMTKKGVNGDILTRDGPVSSGGYENVPLLLSHEDSTADKVSLRR